MHNNSTLRSQARTEARVIGGNGYKRKEEGFVLRGAGILIFTGKEVVEGFQIGFRKRKKESKKKRGRGLAKGFWESLESLSEKEGDFRLARFESCSSLGIFLIAV